MSAARLASPDPKRPSLTTVELIAMVGGLMALNALSIDILLPALPAIGADFGALGNDRQLVITSYVFGFGLAQLAFGPIADSIGRRQTLIWALWGYLAATVLCVIAPAFTLMLAARALQGAAAAATRVVAMAVVRDLVSGRRMAEIMSFAMTVFMAAPILAPGLGQIILLAGPWEAIFIALLAGSAILLAWMMVRLPETLRPEDAIAVRLGPALRNYALAASNRTTLGYMIASSLIFGALFAFIATSEQVIAGLYGLRGWFGVAFGGIALGLAAVNIVNARIVGRYGMRRISHLALVAFIAINAVHALISLAGQPPFWLFYALLGTGMFMFGLIGANFSALVMEPAGRRAGTAAALYGAVTSISGAVLGSLIGQAYDGSVTPLIAGMAILGAACLAVVFVTEKGRLFGDYATETPGTAGSD